MFYPLPTSHIFLHTIEQTPRFTLCGVFQADHAAAAETVAEQPTTAVIQTPGHQRKQLRVRAQHEVLRHVDDAHAAPGGRLQRPHPAGGHDRLLPRPHNEAESGLVQEVLHLSPGNQPRLEPFPSSRQSNKHVLSLPFGSTLGFFFCTYPSSFWMSLAAFSVAEKSTQYLGIQVTLLFPLVTIIPSLQNVKQPAV